MHDDIKLVRAFCRQAVIHARKHSEEIESQLADAMASVEKGCKCKACKMLRQLAVELKG